MEDNIMVEISIPSLQGTSFIPIENSFTLKYKLYAVSDSSVLTEIEIAVPTDSSAFTEIVPRVIGESQLQTDINIMYGGNSHIYAEIQPFIYNSIETEIEVNPHNRMWALYEVTQPPTITNILIPTQDSFTREKDEYQSINYGASASMVVGRTDSEIWRSFVQFDTSSINSSYLIKESKLRLYYKGATPSNVKIELTEIGTQWTEYSITDLNRPVATNIVTSDFTVNQAGSYIEFDVSKTVQKWIANSKTNNGLTVRLANESVVGQTTFHTRETHSPPELIVEYYDSRIFSHGRSQIVTEINAINTGNSDVKTEIEVNSTHSFSSHFVEIYVHRFDVPLDSDILTQIETSVPNISSEITSAHKRENEVLTEISISNPDESGIDTEIVISKPTIPVEIEIALVRDSEVVTAISISRPIVYAEISVPVYGDSEILTEIDINLIHSSSIITEIVVSKEAILAEIAIRIQEKESLYTEISVSRPVVYVEVAVRERSDILVEIEPNIKSDVSSEISVSRPEILTEIRIVGWLYGESEIESELLVRAIDGNTIDSEISISKPLVYTEIVVPTWDSYERLSEIQPRILLVNNINTVIQVGKSGGAYAFII